MDVSPVLHMVARSIVPSPSPRPSPSGRGRIATSGSAIQGFDCFQRRDTILPLPGGEGRGEGEEAAHLARHIESEIRHNNQLPITNYQLPILLVLSILLCSLNRLTAAPGPKDTPPPRTYIIGLSPFLNKSVKDDIYRSIVRLVVQDLPLNSTVTVYDAFELKTITQISIPDSRVFDSPKTRANQFAPAIHEVKLFLAQDHSKPAAPHLNFDSALRLPQFLDFLSDNVASSTDRRTTSSLSPSDGERAGVRRSSAVSLLLIGSPLYQDAKEPAFSMVDGYFPSDGHLQANREQSIFGYTSLSKPAPPLLVHWIYFGDPWLSDLHKEKITRFWTLYLERRGAQLASFAADLSTICQAFTRPSTEDEHSQKQWAIDAAQKRIEMLRISRNVEVADWLTGTSLSDTAQTPPSNLNGPMKIGIRWKANIDLDLYATPVHGAETLFFQHVRSPEGYYYKDHRSSPGKEFEFIEFETPVDARQVEAFVNFYKGYCPSGPQGEIRIEFDGKIYGAPFAIPAEEGNQGRTGRSQQDFWTRIPVQQILKIHGQPNGSG